MSNSVPESQIKNDISSILPLLRELQNNLYMIARAAELNIESNDNLIQSHADKSLSLIDSYISTLMYESGQLALELNPVGLGNVIYDLSHNIKLNFDKNIEVQKTCNLPAMTNSTLLGNSLFLICEFLLKMSNKNLIIKSSINSSEKIIIQIYGQNFKRFKSIVNGYNNHQILSHMPYAKYSDSNGLGIIIASRVINILGGKLAAESNSKYSGFSIDLPISKQLSLV